MRNPHLYLDIPVLLVSGSFRKSPPPETALFKSFSLDTIVKGMKVPELRSFSSGSDGSEELGEMVRRQRDQFTLYKVAERKGSKFDDIRFIARLQAEVDKMIGAAGVRLDCSES